MNDVCKVQDLRVFSWESHKVSIWTNIALLQYRIHSRSASVGFKLDHNSLVNQLCPSQSGECLNIKSFDPTVCMSTHFIALRQVHKAW
jgi:hypothetical protein